MDWLNDQIANLNIDGVCTGAQCLVIIALVLLAVFYLCKSGLSSKFQLGGSRFQFGGGLEEQIKAAADSPADFAQMN